MSAAAEHAVPRPARDLPAPLLWLLAVALPLGLLALHHDLGHQGDMRSFFEWHQAVRASPAFYRDGHWINYPILGVLACTLPARLWELLSGQAALDFAEFRLVHKAFLAALEMALILVTAALGRALGLRRPRALAVGLYLLPATWGQGAWFGQIDSLGSLLLLSAALGAVRLSRAAWDPTAHRPEGHLALGLAGLAGAVLTKQLTLFSVPGLAAMLSLGLILHRRCHPDAPRAPVAVIAASALALLVLPDLFLSLPGGHRFHLGYILFGGGSPHGNVLSGNGANLWALISRDPSASALTTTFFGVAARHWGIALFAAVQAVLLGGWVVPAGRRLWRSSKDPGSRTLQAVDLGLHHVGITNLAMATLLTGVHERYLVHGVPFLILGFSSGPPSPVRHRIVAALAWAVCGWTGLFVLSSIHWESFGGALRLFRSHTLTGVLQLGLLAVLLAHLLVRARRPAGTSPPGGSAQ